MMVLELAKYGPPPPPEKSRYDGETEEERRSQYRNGLIASGLQLTRKGTSASNAVAQFATGSSESDQLLL